MRPIPPPPLGAPPPPPQPVGLDAINGARLGITAAGDSAAAGDRVGDGGPRLPSLATRGSLRTLATGTARRQVSPTTLSARPEGEGATVHPQATSLTAGGTARCDPSPRRLSSRRPRFRKRHAAAGRDGATVHPHAEALTSEGTARCDPSRRRHSVRCRHCRMRHAPAEGVGATVHPHTLPTAEGAARCDPSRSRPSVGRRYLRGRSAQALPLTIPAVPTPSTTPPLLESTLAMVGHRSSSPALEAQTR